MAFLPDSKTDLARINRYQEILNSFNHRPPFAKVISLPKDHPTTTAIQISFGRNTTYHNGLFTDWDDTIENYSRRKKEYYQKLSHLLPSSENKDQFINCLMAINKASRLLPASGSHPEHYAPILDLTAETKLLELIKQQISTNVWEKPSEETARSFITEEILSSFPNQISQKEENNKTYFIESSPDSITLDYLSPPSYVNPSIWDQFKTMMTDSNLPDTDITLLDITDETYWIVVSFGEIEFQLNKILSGLQKLRQTGNHLPNEIIIFKSGRKEPVIKQIRNQYPTIPFLYIDDSLRQLKTIRSDTQISVLQAVRTDAKRSKEADPTIPQAQMENCKISTLLNAYLK